MEGTLRVTMRYDSLYKYDVDVDCVSVSPKGPNSSGKYGFDTSKKCCTFKGGYSLALLQEILLYLNLKLELVTDVWAYDFENATQNGIDLFASMYVLRSERVKLVDPTFPTAYSKLKVFINHDYEATTHDILFTPFDMIEWFGILGLLILSTISVVFIQFTRTRLGSYEFFKPISVYDAFFESVAAALQKGTVKLHSRPTSLRTALSTISISYLFFFNVFSGAIIAMLSVRIFGINTLESLVKSNYEIMLDKGYNNGSSSQLVLEQMSKQDPFLRAFLRKASKTKVRFESFEQSVYKVQNQPLALVTEADSAYGAISNSAMSSMPCSWSAISVRDIQYPTSMFMRKNSPYKDRINKLLLTMSERGVMKNHQRKWIPSDQSQCRQTATATVYPVDMNNIFSAFETLLIGVFLAIVVVLGEIVFQSNKSCFCKRLKHRA